MTRLPLKPNLMTPEELSLVEQRQTRVQRQLTRRIELDLKDNFTSSNGHEATRRGRLKGPQTRSKQVSFTLEEDLVIGKFRRDVQKAMRLIYLQLAKAGKEGVDSEDLRDRFHLENLVLIEAIKKLEKLNKVEWLDDGRLTTVESLKQAPGKTYNIYIEKILPGRALVLVDDKWHARLNQYDYDGPRGLLKTGSEFKAIGDLYRDSGILTLRIRQVIFGNY
jgi:hypothetical protein